jgi:hypothetical protein
MRAGDHHPQFVVAGLVRHSRAAGRNGLILAEHGGEFLSGPDRFAPQSIQRTVAGDRHDPSASVVGHAVTRPGPQCLGEGLLNGVFGDSNIARPACERREQRVHTRAERRCSG